MRVLSNVALEYAKAKEELREFLISAINGITSEKDMQDHIEWFETFIKERYEVFIQVSEE